MIRSNARRGFTLVEMLVVMALIAFLAAMSMIIVPGILEKDRSVDAVSNLESWLQISRARAVRDKNPRGLRLIVDPATLKATEAQYIESPPVLVVNPNPPYPNNLTASFAPHPLSPRVEFAYTIAGPSPPGIQPQGSITGRQCWIRGLTSEQADQIVSSAAGGRQPSLWLPVLGTWHRIKLTGAATAQSPATSPVSYFVSVELDHYPDMQLGMNDMYRTFHFGIYGPPRPLLGEPVMQLPTNTCVDLNPNASFPAGTSGLDHDILFAPSGQLAFTAGTGAIGGAGHVFMLIRDDRKVPTMDLTNLALIQQGGEMMIVAIKAKSGAIGAAPVDHNPLDPYALARQSVAGQ